MRFRSLALFALTAGLVALAGDLTLADAQDKANKKGKKNKKADPPAAVPPAAVAKPAVPVEVKPVVITVATPKTKDAAALARVIDDEINKRLVASKLAASARSTDDEFLRRVSLDITGVIPTAARAKAFLDDTSPDKRARLIDELLADPHFGRRMADIWAAKLFPRDSANRFVLKDPLYKWLEEQFNANPGWDKLVTALVTATGTVADNPATTYFLANRSVDKLTDTTSQHFLGIQLQCAQCHNHPFTSWKQTEYWGMAAFYSKVKADNPKNANKGGDNTQIGVQEGRVTTRQKDFFPESAKTVPARYLGGEQPALGAADPYRPALAKWMTSSTNPFFAKALVNRTWAHLFGRGFVNPVDDMLPENEATHPDLLNALAHHVSTAAEFDLKYLIKAICLSETYQRTSKPTAENKADHTLYSHPAVKVMSPEQLYDSLAQVTGNNAAVMDKKGAKGQGAQKGVRLGARDQFVNFFLAGADSTSALDYEAGIPQALKLMNAPITNNPAAARAVIGQVGRPEEAFERIYLACLSRRPTSDEVKNLNVYVTRIGTPTAYGDILWAVLNSSEFTLVR
ncbi:DUF1549 and DUF1553 domain-containing protein [Gemmata sp. JC673]|uniref:DUF1549 and DUF1553 domain-containing protein n=1 Tax=Gemmata algarum TaxID=2975278 RepID=A0ABU5EVE8_9BACT|nr:DUF1549 and DUF1553 domain-containing protein [Gemmata algarum]MDY3559209.1 DUF1549 and DUF1553 domain-containing protein [Gemmata algarum]